MAKKEPFERVVAAHGERVLRVCRVILGPHEADDAWSETFISAMRAYPDLPADANLEAWLVTIAHRKTLDFMRAARRRPVPLAATPEPTSAPRGPSDGAQDLWQAVRALPDKQRQAIAYHFVAGLPYAEVADVLGGSADAARRAAADGIKTLRLRYDARSTQGEP